MSASSLTYLSAIARPRPLAAPVTITRFILTDPLSLAAATLKPCHLRRLPSAFEHGFLRPVNTQGDSGFFFARRQPVGYPPLRRLSTDENPQATVGFIGQIL